MLTLDPFTAKLLSIKNATARLDAAADVTAAYRVARARRAAYLSLCNSIAPRSRAAHEATNHLRAADLQLDAAIHTEQTAKYALMRAKELGK